MLPNEIAGVGAGWIPEFIEMTQVGICQWAGSAQLRLHV